MCRSAFRRANDPRGYGADIPRCVDPSAVGAAPQCSDVNFTHHGEIGSIKLHPATGHRCARPPPRHAALPCSTVGATEAKEGRVPVPADVAWANWDVPITDWSTALKALNSVSTRFQGKTAVWRGVRNASWSMHSSLRRRVEQLGEKDPEESRLQEYELAILHQCRSDWRYDDLPALEILAHLQHFGGPTRLIDVTSNPLIALWFAVESNYASAGVLQPETDGRLFVFSIAARVTLQKHDQIDWGSRELPWAGLAASDGWGRVVQPPVLWVPPAYNSRISAQNAGFLIGGTPASWADGNRWREGPGTGRRMLKIKEVRDASSLYVRPAALANQQPTDAFPTFTLRVAADAKREIRDQLERVYGYRPATIYPDLFGLAANILPSRIP